MWKIKNPDKVNENDGTPKPSYLETWNTHPWKTKWIGGGEGGGDGTIIKLHDNFKQLNTGLTRIPKKGKKKRYLKQ